MTMWITIAVVSVALALLAGWALPALAARMLVPTLAAHDSSTVNYRGLRVPHGLGLVWVAWAIGIATLSNVLSFGSRVLITSALSSGVASQEWWMALGESPFMSTVVAVPVLLVIGAAALGLADDVFGGGDKGFRGHLAALREGRLTTGMLKLLGIGMLALVSATGIASTIGRFDPMIDASTGWAQGAYTLLAWIAATLVIALAANFVNLTDLRPGRALKAYLPLALAGAGLSIWGLYRVLEQRIIASAAAEAVQGAAAATPGLPSSPPEIMVWLAGSAVCLLLLALGPVFALWRHDLGERAMLGDAGANAMGAFAGYLLARSAPLWLLGVFALVLLALNLASERVSFSAVIERVRFLSWIDGLGRTAAGTEVRHVLEQGSDDGEQAGGPDSTGDDARRDDVS